MGSHIDSNGRFQSDKYPTTPPDCVPLKVTDPTAQDLLAEYAKRRRVVDAEFSDDLEARLAAVGYKPPIGRMVPIEVMQMPEDCSPPSRPSDDD